MLFSPWVRALGGVDWWKKPEVENRYTDQSPNDHSPNDQSSNDQSPNDQSPNFLKCDQSPNATNLRTNNLRMRPILVNIPDFLMFILPACCSVYLIGNEKFRGFSWVLLSIIFLTDKIYQRDRSQSPIVMRLWYRLPSNLTLSLTLPYV
jgi:hypothetical protein